MKPNIESVSRESFSPAAPGLAQEKGCRVVVVDDNGDTAQLMKMLLESRGCEVRCTHDGASAVALAREFNPDVVLLDIGLPDIDGYEVLRRLRATPGIKPAVVALSGYTQPADVARIKEAGFDYALRKPADRKVVLALVASLSRSASG